MAEDLVNAGRIALQAGRWAEAAELLEAAAQDEATPEALDALAEIRYWQGDYAAAVDLHERAFAGYRARGETRRAAVLAAYHLAFEYVAVYGNAAASRGWLERGKRLAEGAGECVERGWVELACALLTNRPEEKERGIAAASEAAERFGDVDLAFDALAYEGVRLVERGLVDDGLRDLDEAAAAVRGGEVTGVTAGGEIYCKMLLACELTLDVRRAAEWTEAANSLADRSNAAWASAICRMHYGAVLTAAGRWGEAEAELTASLATYDRGYRALRSGAVVRLADLRVRQGRFEEAEALLAGQEHDAGAVQPLAQVRLARGEPEVAATLLRRYVRRYGDGVLQAPVLALLAEAEAAGGHLDEARGVVGRLEEIAQTTRRPLDRALAAFAAAVVDEEGAVGHLEVALDGFLAAGLPFEQARTRLSLARRLVDDRPAVAVAEAKSALATFDDLGARAWADVTAALLRTLGEAGRTGPRNVGALTRREAEVLALLGRGLSNAEIGDRLFITTKTASHHVSNVLAKLGLRNRTEAAAYAVGHRSAR